MSGISSSASIRFQRSYLAIKCLGVILLLLLLKKKPRVIALKSASSFCNFRLG